MTVGYWTAQDVLKQVAGELGLPRPTTITGIEDVQSVQLLSLLNSGGNELLLYYPWEQFVTEWLINVADGINDRPVPDDLSYFTNQTQWDRTNHWPLLGPKSPQEWAWLKGALVAPLPRLRFRIQRNLFTLYPTPSPSGTPHMLAMEYISKNWVESSAGPASMIVADSDVLLYDPWLLIKFVKFKFYELKGFPTAGVNGDFMRVFNSLTGKDTGAEILSLSPQRTNQFVGPWSVPDGSWNVYG